MSGIAGFVVGLLQSIFAFFGVSQTTPTLPPSLPVQIPQQSSTQPNAAISQDATSPCSMYANLKKGDTDATTNGKVSQLQAYLGISPTTGSYGAQTAIGYQNKCGNVGNSQPTSVPGMSEYVDSNFGFSFWYPSSWTVSQIATTPSVLASANEVKGIRITNSQGLGFDIDEVQALNGTITTYYAGKAGQQGCEVYINFNTNLGEWTDECVGDAPQAASFWGNTMGGLHVLMGESVNTQTIVPLSADNFVVITRSLDTNPDDNPDHYDLDIMALTNTIVATNPAVAIPVSTAQQIATIEAEANAYGASNNTVSPSWVTAENTSGPAPLEVSFAVDHQGTVNANVDFGDGTQSEISQNDCGLEYCTVTHTYPTSGTYVARQLDSSGNALQTFRITVTGSSASSLQTYTNSQYGFSLQYPSTLSLQTNGYESTHPFVALPVAYINANDSIQTEGYVSVNVSSSASDVANCSVRGAIYNAYSGSPAFVSGANILINRNSFVRSDRSDGGSVAGLERDYAAMHNGACYDVQIITFPAACVSSGCSNRQWSLQTETSLLNYLDQIAQSFRFAQ